MNNTVNKYKKIAKISQQNQIKIKVKIKSLMFSKKTLKFKIESINKKIKFNLNKSMINKMLI